MDQQNTLLHAAYAKIEDLESDSSAIVKQCGIIKREHRAPWQQPRRMRQLWAVDDCYSSQAQQHSQESSKRYSRVQSPQCKTSTKQNEVETHPSRPFKQHCQTTIPTRQNNCCNWRFNDIKNQWTTTGQTIKPSYRPHLKRWLYQFSSSILL